MPSDIHLEQEMKFAVGPAFDLPDLRDVLGRSVRQPERTFTTSYFDTPDLRLWSRSITLRYRSLAAGGPGSWTVKLPEPKAGATLDRQEISWPGTKEEVPPEARALLRGVVRRAELDEVVEMATTRRPWTLGDRAGNEWAELDYDEVTVVGGPKDGLRFREIEIERSSERLDDRVMSAATKALRRAGAQPDDRPKLAKALGIQPDRRSPLVSKPGRAWTAADIVRYAIDTDLERLLDHDYRLRLRSDDPDRHDIHQARVATRRLRSRLKTLRPLLDPVWLTHTEGELRWMGLLLGAVRDPDVKAGMLARTAHGKLQPPASSGLAELRAKVGFERVGAVARLADALVSQRYLDLLDRLHAAASQPPLTSGSDNVPRPLLAADVLPKLVGKRWRKIKKEVKAAGGSPSAPQLHQIRIAAKNLRYACELSQPVVGKAARKTGRAAEDVQAVLGDHHDTAVLIDWLTSAAMTGPAQAAFAAGGLVTGQERRRRKLEKQWHHSWAKLSRPARRRWLT